MKQALLVIDVQNDYFKGGKKELADPEPALRNINRCEAAFMERQLPVIYIQHLAPAPDAAFFAIGSTGAELHHDLHINASSLIITKHYPNSFLQTSLSAALKELAVEQLVIGGMMTHMCIDSTTRAAAELGFQPILIADATATCDLEANGEIVTAKDVQNAFIAALRVFSDVRSTSDYLDTL